MYVITGATGNTGKIITEKLLAEGKKVRIISFFPPFIFSLLEIQYNNC